MSAGPGPTNGTVGATATPVTVESWVLDTVGTMTGDPAGLTRAIRLDALDIDSLDLVELWQLLQDDLGIVIDPAELREAETVGDVIDFIEARRP
jgi:acyl carrier protein